jgi:O-glycosyl hydrolase
MALHSLLVLGFAFVGFHSAALGQTITVDLSQKQQVIEGFGGFGPAKVWWDSGPYFDQAWLDKLDDLGVSIVRTAIYWDFQKQDRTFNFDPASDNGKQIDYLKALQKRGIKILATAWTPPVWMKQNPNDSLAPFCHGQCGGTLAPAHYQDFADFLVNYVRQMQKAGVDIYAVNFANEPLFANPFESCVYTEKSYAAVLRVVGESFTKSGLATKLFGPEHMGSADWNAGFFKNVLADPDTVQFLSFYAVHGYSDGVAADYGNAEGWTRLYQHASKAGVELWMTETSDFKRQGWDKAFVMAKELHLALRFGRISGWVYWYMAGGIMGEAPENEPTPLYYAFKQYYRFVRPGFVQVGSATDDREILPTAFSCGAGLTVVLINNGTSAKSVTVHLATGEIPTFDGYRTSRTENTVAIGETTRGRVELPAQSITTLVALGTKKSNSDGARTTDGSPGGGLPTCGADSAASHVQSRAIGASPRRSWGCHRTTIATAAVIFSVSVLLAIGWIRRIPRA